MTNQNWPSKKKLQISLKNDNICFFLGKKIRKVQPLIEIFFLQNNSRLGRIIDLCIKMGGFLRLIFILLMAVWILELTSAFPNGYCCARAEYLSELLNCCPPSFSERPQQRNGPKDTI